MQVIITQHLYACRSTTNMLLLQVSMVNWHSQQCCSCSNL